MKKFLMYTVVLVTMLFIGYTTYYFLKNNEEIYMTLAEGESVYLNKDETIELPIAWTKAYKSTKVYENVSISDTDVVSFDIETKRLIGLKGGVAQVVVTPSNEEFGPFRFDVYVGDGSILYPYYIQTDLELSKIGTTDTWGINSSYMLVNDIDLKSFENGFSPIGTQALPFSGNFDGNNKTISNLKVTSAQNAGLFGATSSSAVVSNLTLKDAQIIGMFDNAGAIVGLNKGVIRLCNVINLKLENLKELSNNGGIAGYTVNTSVDNQFVSFGYIDMCSVSVDAKTSGNFGGIVGKLEGGVVYNSKSVVNSYQEQENSLSFGSIVGHLKNAKESTKYMFSVVKNSYAMVVSLTLNYNNAKIGAVVGINEDEGTLYKNILKSVYYNILNTYNPVGESNTTIDVTTVKYKTIEQLNKQETYQEWDFENVWTIDEGNSPAEIGFGYAEAQTLNEYIPGAEITSLADLESVINSVRNNPSSEVVYEITNDLVLDLEGIEWQTIAPNIKNPLKASFICKDATLTIKNFKLSNNNSSFFGYISGVNSLIDGIVFEDVSVTSNTETVAVVCDALLDNATIKNCNVNNANIEVGDNAKKVAVIAGENRGKILNVAVNNNVLNTNEIKISSLYVDIGGITALNMGNISNCTIAMYNISIETDSVDDAFINYGGICAKSTNGELNDCYNYDCSFVVNQINGVVNAGGVVGEAVSNSQILRCFSEGLISLPYTNNRVYVGGVVAVLDFTSFVKQCYYANQTLQGYYVGGVAQTNNGIIDQCYFKGDAKGVVVAGLVVKNTKTLTNSYVTGSLSGITDQSKVSGLVSQLPVGGLVEYCFSAASFAGNGTQFAETEAEFRATIEQVGQWFDRWQPTGELKNCIVINYGEAYVQGSLFGIIKTGWINCSSDQAKGLVDDYSPFKKDAKFDQNIWTFNNDNGNGAYPTLTYVVQNPNQMV